MANFEFLKNQWHSIYEMAAKAEKNVYSDPRAACFYARLTLENSVNWLYKNDEYLQLPYSTTLNSLLHEQTFKDNLDPKLFPKLKIIQKTGNIAAHIAKALSERDALHVITELFHFTYWMYRYYSTGEVDRSLVFSIDLIPKKEETTDKLSETLEKLKAKENELLAKEKLIKEAQEKLAKIQESKAKNKQVPDNYDYNEAETREYFIDVLLKEAGWNPDYKNVAEYKVWGMPNDKGEGFVDYVLWGNDGLPLAVVEAKRTKKDAKVGQQQAKLYADCLEEMRGQRPVIFYTNGYEHYIWDDLNYPPRSIQGFYKKDELQLMINRRKTKQNIEKPQINKNISGRPYQEEAIKSVCKEFKSKKRKCLVVMATGTGKTRTAISLVDILQKNNWVKRVLFLADRTALLNQAKNAFKKHLPNCNPLDITEDKGETNSRVILSTYQTMMNLIDSTKSDHKVFGVGHFDLIIIDEAHRSVYKKFKAIFDYFDSLMIGLTATPRNEVDKNTYELFELEEGVPTFYYELEKAVPEGYLVPPRSFSVPVKFIQEGIKYSELSKNEKLEYEEKFYDEETNTIPEFIDPAKLNKWLFNKDTVDKVLEHLMLYGIKVNGGDKLGKTIIFAKNHDHAEYIKDRFDANYKHYKGHFARVIDNYATYAQSLINAFSEKEKEPTIAISVDMLDTGIDVPEVLNLVFFKIVRSKTKFHQMIGRGTRLCSDLFGPKQDKEHFYIFDFCQNFEYFESYPEGAVSKNQMSLSQRIFTKRLELAQSLKNKDESLQLLSGKLKDILHEQVAGMSVDNFIVRPHRREVEKFSDRKAWDNIDAQEFLEITNKLAPLPSEVEDNDELAKRFDLMILNMQLAVLDNYKGFERIQNKVMEIASKLEDKRSVPLVNAQLELIRDMQTSEFWEYITIPMLEEVRVCIRNLMQFLDKNNGKEIIYSDFEDEIGLQVEVKRQSFETASDLAQYRKKVEFFLREHQDHITINKLKFNKQITSTDIEELEKILFKTGEDKEKLDKILAGENLGVFIRKIVGLDRKAAEDIFTDYLNEKNFNLNQITFIRKIIDYLTYNGTMNPQLLYEPPFTDIHFEGLDGLFKDDRADDIIHQLKEINRNANFFVQSDTYASEG